MKFSKDILIALIILIACSAVYLTSISASGVTSSATVLNAAPTVGVGLAPDDNGAPGVQVINEDWETQNRTVMITATVTDMNGWDDLTGIVTAVITGPSSVDDSPVSLTFDHNTSVATAVYTGSFNMSDHAEGDYTVNVTTGDSGGLSGSGQENFTYLHTAGDVAIYDFTTGTKKDKWAFRKQHFAKPPADNGDPNDEFKMKEYGYIKVDEGAMLEDASASEGFYAIHRFDFSIAEPEGAVTKIDILWDGKGEHDCGTDGATLYIWNFETGAYEQLDSSTDVYITLEGGVTASIEEYLGPGGDLIFIAEQNTAQNTAQWELWQWAYRLLLNTDYEKCHSRLGTDYVKVEVTYTPQPEVVVLDVTPSADVAHPSDKTKTDSLPAEVPRGRYGFVSTTWDACWAGCEETPCYSDGCCDGMQDRYDVDDVFEVVL
jgi:hypothetical protein